MCTLIKGNSYEERFQRLLELTRKLAGDPDIELDQAVYRSEKRTGSKNRALAYLLKSNGMIRRRRGGCTGLLLQGLLHVGQQQGPGPHRLCSGQPGQPPQTDQRVFPGRTPTM